MKWILFVLIPLVVSCDKYLESNNVSCGCSVATIQVIAVDSLENIVDLDSIYFVINSDTLKQIYIKNLGASDSVKYISPSDTVVNSISEGSTVDYSLYNNREGEYKVWCYYKNESSDTVDIVVKRTGNPDCDLISTMGVQFEFGDDSKKALLQKVGSCGDK